MLMACIAHYVGQYAIYCTLRSTREKCTEGLTAGQKTQRAKYTLVITGCVSPLGPHAALPSNLQLLGDCSQVQPFLTWEFFGLKPAFQKFGGIFHKQENIVPHHYFLF